MSNLWFFFYYYLGVKVKCISGASLNRVSTQIIPLSFGFLPVIIFTHPSEEWKTTRPRRCESAWKPNSATWHLWTITLPLGRYSALPLRVSSLFLLWHHAGVPGRPEITGFTKPAMEGDVITLTCTTSGSKPAANIRWFRNDKEVQGEQRVARFPTWAPCRATQRLRHCQIGRLVQPIVLVFVHCSFGLGGFLQVPSTAWLVANVAAVVCTGAVHISLCDWGVDVLTTCPVCFPGTCPGFWPRPGHPALVLCLFCTKKNRIVYKNTFYLDEAFFF